MTTNEIAKKHCIKEKLINKKPLIISYIKMLGLFVAGFLIMQTFRNAIYMIRRLNGGSAALEWFEIFLFPIVLLVLIFVSCKILGRRNLYIGLKSALTTTLLIHIIYILIMYSRSWNMYIADDIIYNSTFFVDEMGHFYSNTTLFWGRWLYYVLDCFPARWFQMFAPMVVYIIVKAKEAKMQNVDEIES